MVTKMKGLEKKIFGKKMMSKWFQDRLDMALKEKTVFRKRSGGPAEQLIDGGTTFETENSDLKEPQVFNGRKF